jgi:hypothetical protein
MKESILLSSAVSARGFGRLAIALSLGCGLGMAQVRVSASNPVIEIRSLSTSGAAAETSEGIQGPVLGYVFESATQSLLPILGIAGSSHLGSPIQLGPPWQAIPRCALPPWICSFPSSARRPETWR